MERMVTEKYTNTLNEHVLLPNYSSRSWAFLCHSDKELQRNVNDNACLRGVLSHLLLEIAFNIPGLLSVLLGNISDQASRTSNSYW